MKHRSGIEVPGSWKAAALAAAFAIAALPGAAGAVICVDPAGGGCKKKIQAAIDAAAPGEEIQVHPGYYRENLEILTEGIILAGTGRYPQDVVVDGQASDDVVSIEAPRVVVRNLKVINGSSYGFYIDAPYVQLIEVKAMGSDTSSVYVDSDGRHALLMNSTFTQYGNVNVDINANKVQVIGCYLSTGDDEGISAIGDNVRVENNTVRNCEDDNGIYVEGNGALIRGNRVDTTDYELIEIDGDDGIVEGNRVHAGSEDGIYVDGDGNRVRDNIAYGSYGYGIAAYGDRYRVTNNVVHDITDDYGIDAHCDSCTSALVAGNQIYNVPDDETGLHADGDAPGLVVRDNVLHHVSDEALEVDGVGVQVIDNTVYACGAENEAAFDIEGDDHLIQGNFAHDNNGEGFAVAGSNNRLVGNKAKRNYEEGILVESGDGNRLIGNVVSRNINDGIAIRGAATNTVVKRNRSLENSFYDFNDDGIGTVLGTGSQANNFGTVAP